MHCIMHAHVCEHRLSAYAEIQLLHVCMCIYHASQDEFAEALQEVQVALLLLICTVSCRIAQHCIFAVTWSHVVCLPLRHSNTALCQIGLHNINRIFAVTCYVDVCAGHCIVAAHMTCVTPWPQQVSNLASSAAGP